MTTQHVAPVTVIYNTKPFSFRDPFRGLVQTQALLTAEHPASSRGLPVVVINGQAYGPADLTSPDGTSAEVMVSTDIDDELEQAAIDAGWLIVREQEA